MGIYLLIPAYQPDERLVPFVRELTEEFKVVVVDDGSAPACRELFSRVQAEGATVLYHGSNLGKGAALKTGLHYIKELSDASGVITADADGQHGKKDILRIRDAMLLAPDTLFLGGRDFKKMPPRSRFGNTMTRFFFRLFTGIRVSDTQTGLRGLPAYLFDRLLELSGERYEYEMNMLLALKHWGAAYEELPIETIYIDNNRASHFHALRDGWRVFSRVVKYSLSSLGSTAFDYVLYALLLFVLRPSWSYGIAKACAAVLNFELNCRFVFHGRRSFKNALGYAALALFSMSAGAFLVSLLTKEGMNNFLAKLIIDLALFFLNYLVQKYLIFKKAADKAAEKGA
ncbi:MAG: bifunctional glycosyltransferase family 2/GtrA family protein [Clostridiaceae bacterium]|nr:bifunctional glycosyltransferase family 2/GtrA family protein [Eubacteriales bacterium]